MGANRQVRLKVLRGRTTLLSCERGQGLAEYIIIAILVAIGVIVGIRQFGGTVTEKFENASGEISTMREGASKEGSTSSDVSTHVGGAQALGSNESGAKGPIAGGASSGGGVEDEVARLRPPGVGDQEVLIEPPMFDWKFLGTLGAVSLLVGVAVVFAVGRKDKKDKGPKKKKRKAVFKRDSQGGQALVEFLFVSITFLFVILGVIQLAMVLNAYALVRYAAYNAARAAIVHGGNEDKMQEAARLSLVSIFPRHGRADHIRGLTENYLAAVATDNDTNAFDYTFRWDGTPYHFQDKITEVKILDNQGVGASEVVVFDDPVMADKALVTVQVVHRYELVIPLVNRILFYIYNRFRVAELTGGSHGGYDNESLMRLSAETDKLRRAGDSTEECRIPLVAHYTMRLQSDYKKGGV